MKFPSLFDIYTPRELTAHDNEYTSQMATANSWCT